MRGGARPWVLALLAFLLLFPGAAGQALSETCRPPVLEVQRPPVPFEPGGTTTLLFAIENPNGAPVDAVRATVTTTAPAGWTATASQRELTLGPDNVSVDVLAVTAPNRGSGRPAGNITISVTFVCTSGEIQTSASSTAAIEVHIRSLDAPWPVLVGVFLLLAGTVAAFGVRRLRRGVAVTPSEAERTVAPGKSVKFVITLENRRGRPEKFHFLAVGVPEGWSAHLALTDVDLEPGEEKALWAILKAPPTAAPGDVADVTLRLESPRGARESVAARIRARVAAEP